MASPHERNISWWDILYCTGTRVFIRYYLPSIKTLAWQNTQNTFFQYVFSYFILILFFFRRSAQLVKEDDDSAIPYCASIGDVDTVLASQIVLCWCFRSYFYWLPPHFHRVVFVTSYLTISCGSPWYTKSTCNHWLLFAESNVLGI